MRFRLLVRRGDFLLACLVCASGLIASGFLYAGTVEAYGRRVVSNAILELGTKELAVLSGEMCVGRVSYSLDKQDEQYQILVSGEIRTSVRGQRSVNQVSVDGSFNLFGQLIAALIEVKSPNAGFRVGLFGIEPLVVRFRGTERLSSSEKRFEIPGPLYLREHSRGRYMIEYAPLTHVNLGAGQAVFEGLMKDIALQITDDPIRAASCPDSIEAVVADPLLNRLAQQVAPLIKIFPGFQELSGLTP